jgi:FMN phosphatase YigB (HAD superfamily)
MNNLLKLINKAEVISFDIFDTLITRLYSMPTDLFKHIEEAYKLNDFAEARKSAEVKVREKAAKELRTEISIDEIYEEIDKKFKEYKEKEIELELLMCKRNPEMYEIYQYAVTNNKSILIASDMYLPEKVIESILFNAGYLGYNKLFLSSTSGRSKASGEMYNDILQYTKVDPSKILHIGDHYFTDYDVAIKNGFNAFCYTPIKDSYGNIYNSSFFATLNKYTDKHVASSILQGLVAIKEYNNKENYWYHFGYKYIGMLAFSYAKWLRKEFDSAAINKAYFMLRDGFIIKKVFEKLYPEFTTYELYGSRRMFLFAGMSNIDDIKSHIVGSYTSGVTYRKFYDRLMIENENLENEYYSKFPNADMIISSDAQLAEIEKFLYKKLDIFKEVGKKERDIILEYFDSIGIMNEKVAVVDLGWKASMLKGMEKLCKIDKRTSNFNGYYLGTHQCNTEGLSVTGFAINNGKPDKEYPIKSLLNYGYVIPILELAFSAPHASIIKLTKQEDKFKPIYQEICTDEQKRINICSEILKGVLDFVDDFSGIIERYPVEINNSVALMAMEYFAENVSQYDEKKIMEVSYFPGIGADNTCFPISPRGVATIGVVNPWPGDESAEAEVITRMKKAAEDINIQCIMLDDFGHVLDAKQKRTDTYIDPRKIDFVITTHYETHKTVDAFYYHTLWNPPEIPLNLDYYYGRVTDNYLMNDDYLTYDFGGMKNHLKSILIKKPRNINKTSMLTASFPESSMLEPRLVNPKLFYCGMNWERVVHNSNRHEGLFKLLDNSGCVKFFGPEKVEAWGGIRPWEGYKCYQYSIPFDGFSILQEINECGICLVLSSDIHRRAGAATNRVYEACAAGAVIISDDNEFMQHYFNEAALFINYNKSNPLDTYNQIMEKYEWIKQNKNEALELAKKAQKVFREMFAMDKQLLNLVNNHSSRYNVIKNDLFALNHYKRVLVTYTITTIKIEDAMLMSQKVISNIENQYYENIILGIACDVSIAYELQKLLKTVSARVKIIPLNIFDFKGSQKLTSAQCIRFLTNYISYDYLINTTADEIWFYDHVTTLIRTIYDDASEIAYSGRLGLDNLGYRRTESFEPINANTLFYMQAPNWVPAPGQVIFSREIINQVPDFIDDCLDGYEHYAFFALAYLKYGKKVSFSSRMTFVYNWDKLDKRNIILNEEYQIRFIRDLIKYEMKGLEGSISNSTGINRNVVNELIAHLPIRSWIKLRYHKWRLRRANMLSVKGKKLLDKYNNELDMFLRS